MTVKFFTHQGTVNGTASSDDVQTRTIDWTVKPPATPPTRNISVEAGGPYTTQRAARITLSGKATPSDGASISATRWSFTPGADCPKGTALTNPVVVGQTVTFRPLCSLKAAFYAADTKGQNRESAPVAITVTPRREERSWSTPITHKEAPPKPTQDMRTPKVEPYVGLLQGLEAGVNVSTCTPSDPVSLLCPYQAQNATRRPSQGYQLGALADPRGPFDGFFYVVSTDLTITEKTLINQWLVPQGDIPRGAPPAWGKDNWYKHNLKAKKDAAGYYMALRQHEADHTGAIREAIKSDPGLDPRHVVEAQLGARQEAVVLAVDNALDTNERTLQKKSKAIDDNKKYLWPKSGPCGWLEFFNRQSNRWEPNCIR